MAVAVKCGEPNPEAPGMTCYLKPPHATHKDIAGGEWRHTELREAEKVRRENPIRKPQRKGGSKGLLSATARAAEARRKALEAERIAAGVSDFSPINVWDGTEDGMIAAATSQASEDMRRRLLRAMGQVATQQERLSTNDAWALLISQGYVRPDGVSAQAAGRVGDIGCGLGLWGKTGEKELNRSGNGHSTVDNKVRIYQSKILGRDYSEFEEAIDTKATELAVENWKKNHDISNKV